MKCCFSGTLHAVAYLGYGRHGTCHGRHFDRGRKNCLAKIKLFMYSFLNLYFAPHARDRRRLDGARDTKQVWSFALHVRTWGLSEANALYWRKYLWHCWSFSAPHAVISRPHGDSAIGELFPLSPLVTPLPHGFINCKAVSSLRSYRKH